jgi:fumarate hydratase class II
MAEEEFRVEKDTLGEMRVPASALYGAQTQRAVENFPISGIPFPREFIRALGLVKKAAAQVNVDLGELDRERGEAVARAAEEVAEGRLDEHFPLDIYQTGSGTSTNMNANEVIAARANRILGKSRGEEGAVHPNDHVNRGQSSNDVIPTAIHVAALTQIETELLPALRDLAAALSGKAEEFDGVVKTGRTHMQDAVPIRLGQEFSGYASQVEHAVQRVENTKPHLAELPIGGTALGTGLNAHPELAPGVVSRLSEWTGVEFLQAENLFEGIAAKDALVEASGALKSVAVSMMKIANDLRILGSGPRAGIGEIKIAAVQPGSSIMPGKVNPVIPEMVCQVSAQVIGNDAAVTVGGLTPGLDLQTMMPVMAHNLLQSIRLLARAAAVFRERCVEGLEADEERCGSLVELSTAIATRLNPIIGYEKAAEIAKKAYAERKTVKQVVVEEGILSEEEAEEILDPAKMT